MSVAITIRRAQERDVPALGRLGAALMRTHYAFDERRFLAPGDDAESGYGRFLGSQLQASDTRLMVAEQTAADGSTEIVGYVYAGIEPLSWKELRDEAGFVHDLLVAPAARHTGVGQRLLDAAIDWLREQGMPRVVLWTATPNDSARRLFEGRGFRSTMTEMTLELRRG
jgi:ribosomal protein S18 acetylase RimI-like enzyme